MFKDNLCGLENQNSVSSGVDVYQELNKEAESVKPGSDGLMYLPYLMGERTPHLDPYARGVLMKNA